MAKCKWWRKASCSASFYDRGYRKIYGDRTVKCPKNTDDNCNIKPKTVKIKAYTCDCVQGQHFMTWISNSETINCKIPCTILIDRKYLVKK